MFWSCFKAKSMFVLWSSTWCLVVYTYGSWSRGLFFVFRLFFLAVVGILAWTGPIRSMPSLWRISGLTPEVLVSVSHIWALWLTLLLFYSAGIYIARSYFRIGRLSSLATLAFGLSFLLSVRRSLDFLLPVFLVVVLRVFRGWALIPWSWRVVKSRTLSVHQEYC